MRCLGVEESKMRQAGAWAAEKLGRARFAIAGNEPDGLGLVLTLEGLIMGIAGKKLLWRALGAANLPKAEAFDFKELQHRAEEQNRNGPKPNGSGQLGERLLIQPIRVGVRDPALSRQCIRGPLHHIQNRQQIKRWIARLREPSR